jgi:deoxyribonuclease-4
MFGSHLSIAGSMVNALHEGERLGLECVQVFTKNQQQWKAKPLDDGVVRQWRSEVARLGWDQGGPDGRGGLVSHASYLINLASVSDELFAKSVDLMTDEIERCEKLGIAYLVHHPGSFTGWTKPQGIARIIEAYRELFRRTRGFTTVSCLEGTVGAGSQLGGTFEELDELRRGIAEATGQPARVAVCLDTCHMHAAGYDLSTRASAAAVMRTFDQVCGMAHLKVLHVNDSKGKLGSRLDRHEHIGEGWVGGGGIPHSGTGAFNAARLAESGFAAILPNPALAHVPKILETPKGEAPPERKGKPGKPFDTINLERLRSLLGGPGSGAGEEASGSAGVRRGRGNGPRVEALADAPSSTDKDDAGRRAATTGSRARRKTTG